MQIHRIFGDVEDLRHAGDCALDLEDPLTAASLDDLLVF